MDECEQLRALIPWCTASADTVLTCMSQQPDPSFTCNEQMEPELLGDACSAEASAALDCYFKGPPGGLPDMGPDCTAYCAGQAALQCYSPTCVNDCVASVSAAQPCNGALAALVHCVATDDAVTWSCDAEAGALWSSEACTLPSLLLIGCIMQETP